MRAGVVASIAALALVISEPGTAAPLAVQPDDPPSGATRAFPINIIDGRDDRGSLLELGPGLGLSPTDIDRIRSVSGYVGCLSSPPAMGTATLFLSNRQIVTAAHILFEPSGRPRRKCFFRNQAAEPFHTDLDLSQGAARFGAKVPRPGSAADYAVVRLVEPVPDVRPLPVATTPPRAGEPLIVVSAHPAGMERVVPNGIPVVQGCTIRRVASAPSAKGAGEIRTDCDATGSSSGGVNLVRVGGQLMLRAVTISTGPWRNKRLVGAPFDERAGSQTTALTVDGPVLAAGRALGLQRP